MKSSFVVPVNFKGERAEDMAINLAVHPPSFSVRSGPMIILPGQPVIPESQRTREANVRIDLQGPGAADVKAGRIFIAHATDDFGAELHSSGQPTFYHPAVGSISAEDFIRTPVTALGFSVGGIPHAAKMIEAVNGEIELVIPRLDPAGATAVIENVSTKIGSPVQSPALNAAGVTIVVYDKPTCDRYLADKGAAGGPQEYDVGPLFGPRQPWYQPIRGLEMT